MGGVLASLGLGLTLFGSQRPALHIDLKEGKIFAGNLYLWHLDKQPIEQPPESPEVSQVILYHGFLSFSVVSLKTHQLQIITRMHI